MYSVLITGAGKIGCLIACLLTESKDYQVFLADVDFSGADATRLQQHNQNVKMVKLDVRNHDQAATFLKSQKIDAVISSLPYYCNIDVVKLAREFNLHYFDLTEDVKVADTVKQVARDATTAFVPQCGLAPGFVSIVANTLMGRFDSIDLVKMRVGALPTNTSNALQYSLTWSTDGLINEYGNPCHGLENGHATILQPLEGLEAISIDGVQYEAFNTSGGLGSLVELYQNKVNTMNYKTVRYPGHCDKMRLLMNDLKLNEDRDTLKRILENAIPKTFQDVVIVYVSVSGHRNKHLVEENYVNKIYPRMIAGIHWSAIQVTTASGICAVADLVLASGKKYQGMCYQEQFALDDILQNRFGQYYAKTN